MFNNSESDGFIEHSGNLDGFIAKINKDNHEIIWGTYLGGSNNEGFNSIDIDNAGNLIVAGATYSSDIIVKDAFQENMKGDHDLFVASFNKNGKLNWSSYLGTNSSDNGNMHLDSNFHTTKVAVNEYNNIAVFGSTKDDEAIDEKRTIYSKEALGGWDGFIRIISPEGEPMISSYYGGSQDDFAGDIDYKGQEIYLTGKTYSTDFPITYNANQKELNDTAEGFIGILNVGYLLSCGGNYFIYPTFSDLNKLNITENTTKKGNTLFLTESKVNQTGAAWYNEPMPVRDGFVTTFSFRLTDGFNDFVFEGSSPGADGLAFVIQNHLPDAIGNGGAGIGYEGIPNSLAVEFDTYNNERQQYNETDPNGNHIAIQSNGKEANSTDHSGSANMGITSDIPELRADSTVYYAMIDYSNDGNKLRVWLSENPDLSSENPVLETVEFDLHELLELFDNHKAYVGFTSSTGASHENHELLSWEFCSNEPEENYTSVETQSESKRLVYPNPTDETVTIEAEIHSDSKYYLMDIEGRIYDNERISEKSDGIEVNLKGLSKGVYFLRMINSDLQNSKDYKIIKK